MKILFGIQGTGNGHISRCLPIIEELKALGNEVDILISGVSHELEINAPIKFKKKGLSYIFGKKGGIDLARTLLKCNIFLLIKEIIQCPVKDYQLVITDFEPITAWSSRLRKTKCVGFGNQYAAKHYPVPLKTIQEKLGQWFLNHFAPAKIAIKYDYLQNTYNHTYFPSIEPVQNTAAPMQQNVVVYLPAHNHEALLFIAKHFKDKQFIAFAKWAKNNNEPLSENLKVSKINKINFQKALANANFVITAAGFGLTSELIQLQKNMLIIPMKGQIEQKINGNKLEKLGFKVCYSHKDIQIMKDWFNQPYSAPSFPSSDTKVIAQALLKL